MQKETEVPASYTAVHASSSSRAFWANFLLCYYVLLWNKTLKSILWERLCIVEKRISCSFQVYLQTTIHKNELFNALWSLPCTSAFLVRFGRIILTAISLPSSLYIRCAPSEKAETVVNSTCWAYFSFS